MKSHVGRAGLYGQLLCQDRRYPARADFVILVKAGWQLRDVKCHFAVWRKIPIFVVEMARQCTDMEETLRVINQRLRKLEKSDSEKNEEIGRLNRVIGQKDKEIHSLKMKLSDAEARISELEKDGGGENGGPSGTAGKPEKNSGNSSVPPSQESIAARELRRTRSLRKPSGKPSGGQPGHKGSTLQTVSKPDNIITHEPKFCKCCGRPLDGVAHRKIRKAQTIDIKFVVETTEDQYYEKVYECGCVNNCDAPNCRIKYGDNIRAHYLSQRRAVHPVQENSGTHLRPDRPEDKRWHHTEHSQGEQCKVRHGLRGNTEKG